MYGCQWNWFPCIYWWCDCWQKQQDEFWSVSGNIICSYPAKCFRTHWTALHSADGQWPEAYCESNQRGFFLSMHFTCWRQNWRENSPTEQAGTEDSYSRGLVEHHQGWNPASGDVYAFQTSGCNWLQRICNQELKSESLIERLHRSPDLDVNTLKLKLKVCS